MSRLWLAAVAAMFTACSAPSCAEPPYEPPSPSALSPSAPTSAVAMDATVASLLGRPLRLPTVPAGGACPVSGVAMRSPVLQEADAHGLGTGPLYPITFYIGDDATLRLGRQTLGPGGLYELKVAWASTAGYQGQVVVRAGRLDGAGRGVVTLIVSGSWRKGTAPGRAGTPVR